MIRRISAAFALAAASSLHAQGAPAIPDLGSAAPIAGSWSYAATADGSQASFTGAAGHVQLTIRCVRATRRVSIWKAASAPAASLSVWTSSQARSVPASFDAATARVGAELAAHDPLLDSLASSRGRIGFATPGAAALVLPAWGEVARVVEDCRA